MPLFQPSAAERTNGADKSLFFKRFVSVPFEISKRSAEIFSIGNVTPPFSNSKAKTAVEHNSAGKIICCNIFVIKTFVPVIDSVLLVNLDIFEIQFSNAVNPDYKFQPVCFFRDCYHLADLFPFVACSILER